MYEAWYCYSPVKNNIQDAQKCIIKNTSSFGAAEAEFNFFNCTNKLLQIATIHGFESYKKSLNPNNYTFGPKIILDPKYFLTLQDIRQNLSANHVKFTCPDATVFLSDLY